jgi:hypothetical protein
MLCKDLQANPCREIRTGAGFARLERRISIVNCWRISFSSEKHKICNKERGKKRPFFSCPSLTAFPWNSQYRIWKVRQVAMGKKRK